MQIPDVDAVVHTADFPCIKKSPDVQVSVSSPELYYRALA